MKVSLPKGKLEKGETIEQTALREIKEETGIDGRIVQPLDIIYYKYYHPEYGAMDKEVHFFLVEALSGSLRAQTEEIHSVQWLSPKEAWQKHRLNGYDNNNSVLKKAFKVLGIDEKIEES